MQTFGLPSTPSLQKTLRLKACKNLIIMQKGPIKREQNKHVCLAERRERATELDNSLAGGWFINDFHRKNSMAAQREVQQMSLHPCSREQKLAQIARIRQHSAATKERANLERSKKM